MPFYTLKTPYLSDSQKILSFIWHKLSLIFQLILPSVIFENSCSPNCTVDIQTTANISKLKRKKQVFQYSMPPISILPLSAASCCSHTSSTLQHDSISLPVLDSHFYGIRKLCRGRCTHRGPPEKRATSKMQVLHIRLTDKTPGEN